MQPFDALTIGAVLYEAKPLLVNRKVDKIQQFGRDEVVITLRCRVGFSHLLLSAHASLGRICLVNPPGLSSRTSPPGFCMLLRKHLTGATLIGLEQLIGERIVDMIFACQGEFGVHLMKVFTVELMGRHSNLILWEKETGKILGASHLVTEIMSRHRQVAPGLKYERPPQQERPNIFTAEKLKLEHMCTLFEQARLDQLSVSEWLAHSFAGLGKSLAEELACKLVLDCTDNSSLEEKTINKLLLERILSLRSIDGYAPAMRLDCTGYSVLSWFSDVNDKTVWQTFPSVNDMVEKYFRTQEINERFSKLRERLLNELRAEVEGQKRRIQISLQNLESTEDPQCNKQFGDLILTHINEIVSGQSELTCENLYAEDNGKVTIPLNCHLSASQNAQQYYRQFAKGRARHAAALCAKKDAQQKLDRAAEKLKAVEATTTILELEQIRDAWLGKQIIKATVAPKQKKSNRSRLLSIVSSDGWSIFLGRNRKENDELISRLAKPQDIWMHVLGASGAHVLIKVPTEKQEPSSRTIMEASQLAARLSKAASGGKVRVVYTQCRYVRKVGIDKPGLVTYEREKTIEVDTTSPMPKPLQQLFAQDKARQHVS